MERRLPQTSTDLKLFRVLRNARLNTTFTNQKRVQVDDVRPLVTKQAEGLTVLNTDVSVILLID